MSSIPRHVVSTTTMSMVLAAALFGCTNAGSFPATTSSHTELSRANFRVLEGNVRGSDTGFSLLGLIPIVSPSYGNAMSNLRSKVPVTGRAAALANVTQDASNLYLILFSLPRVTVTADVIEFLPDTQGQAAASRRRKTREAVEPEPTNEATHDESAPADE